MNPDIDSIFNKRSTNCLPFANPNLNAYIAQLLIRTVLSFKLNENQVTNKLITWKLQPEPAMKNVTSFLTNCQRTSRTTRKMSLSCHFEHICSFLQAFERKLNSKYMNTHNGDTPLGSIFLQPDSPSLRHKANQAGKQAKQTAAGWVMVGRCSSRSKLTSETRRPHD